MHIAGGLYHELCEVPKWNAHFGSGGRAAAAVSLLSPGSTLHTYARDENSPGSTSLKALGIKLCCSHSDVAVAFAYFHPLSHPYIEPSLASIPQQFPIQVSGDVVLRFGFVEGSAIVHAGHAIYDPQTSRNPKSFAANGSTAKRLALVMNELELCRYARCSDLDSAAASIMAENDQDTVIIVKRGVRGVTVYERKTIPTHIPAYYSSRVFKIGTGDVFSAIFAHHWAEAGASPASAADLASRSVAEYCETMTLPPVATLADNRKPLTGKAPSQVLLHGLPNTIGRRYTLEEARFRLRELGMEVFSPPIDNDAELVEVYNASLIVITEGLDGADIRAACVSHPFVNLIILDEENRLDADIFSDLGVTLISDFTSALYHAAWPPGYWSRDALVAYQSVT